MTTDESVICDPSEQELVDAGFGVVDGRVFYPDGDPVSWFAGGAVSVDGIGYLVTNGDDERDTLLRDGSPRIVAEFVADEAGDEDGHLDDVEEGCGCVEVWEYLSEQREDDD